MERSIWLTDGLGGILENVQTGMQYYVYIMTNKSGTLYVGVTNNIKKKIYEHKGKLVAEKEN